MIRIKELYYREIALAEQANADAATFKHHLGRAHVISQRSTSLHMLTHVLMLKYAIGQGDFKEVFGQILRLIVTIPGHLLGKVPHGNIGWSTVGLTQQMPIPVDIAEVLKKSGSNTPF